MATSQLRQLGNHIPPSFSKRAGSDTKMGLRKAHSLAWIRPRRYFLPSSYFCSGGSFEAFENALSNFALWAGIFISALKGACAIQNFDLKELSHASHGDRLRSFVPHRSYVPVTVVTLYQRHLRPAPRGWYCMPYDGSRLCAVNICELV